MLKYVLNLIEYETSARLPYVAGITPMTCLGDSWCQEIYFNKLKISQLIRCMSKKMASSLRFNKYYK